MVRQSPIISCVRERLEKGAQSNIHSTEKMMIDKLQSKAQGDLLEFKQNDRELKSRTHMLGSHDVPMSDLNKRYRCVVSIFTSLWT